MADETKPPKFNHAPGTILRAMTGSVGARMRMEMDEEEAAIAEQQRTAADPMALSPPSDEPAAQ